MCKVYNTIGALNTIQNELVNNKIDDFNTLEDLINFQKEVHINEQKIIQQHTLKIQEKKITLEKEVNDFYDSIQTNRAKIKEKQNLKLKILFNKIISFYFKTIFLIILNVGYIEKIIGCTI